MIIESDYLTEGLFGQIFVWMLETLPYIESQGWKPEWHIRTKNYGQAPEFNVFPGIIETQYTPESTSQTVSFESLQSVHKFNFRHEFQEASRYWSSFFRFPADIQDHLDRFWQANLAGEIVLGVHYRGTDKNVDLWQTNPVSRYQFLCVVEDFLASHPDVTAIFVASDDAAFVDAMSKFARVRFYEQERSEDGRPLWNKHNDSDNQAVARAAILDCLTLSRCSYGLKCMSQLSAFSKVFNPDLQMYRVTACKPGWFPEAYVPLYRSTNGTVGALLRSLQHGDFQGSLFAKAMAFPRRMARIREQWQRRGTHASLLRAIARKKQGKSPEQG